MKKTLLEFEHVLVNHEKHYKLINIQNCIEKFDLPTNYIQHGPYYYGIMNSIILVNEFNMRYRIKLGNIFTKDKLDSLIGIMRISGEKFAIINKSIKESNKKWEDTTSIIKI